MIEPEARHRATTCLLPAAPVDAGHIARLHLQTLPDSFLASLGERFLEGMYRTLIDSPQAVVLVAVDDGPIGFAAATVGPGVLTKRFFVRNLHRFALGLARMSVRPSRLRRALSVRRQVGADTGQGAQLLTIAVGPRTRRMGLGSGLVMRLQDDLRARGVDQLWVRVRVDNRTARSFFERLGFHAMGSIELHPQQPELRYATFL